MLHRQFLDELAQRRRGPIRKRLDPGFQDAGLDLLQAVNRLADLMDQHEPCLDERTRAELHDYTEASIRRLERLRYRLQNRRNS
ncbi:MAG: hypothetical protein VKJ87_07045 [Synechococcus sp.]|nr:hypothetical protein [Synechococcus sp.]